MYSADDPDIVGNAGADIDSDIAVGSFRYSVDLHSRKVP
jgi:hypothetical protein